MIQGAALLLLFITCWSIIPAPIMLLLPFSLAGPELSPWFIGAAILIVLFARKPWAVSWICSLSIFCSAVPLISFIASRGSRAEAFRAVVPATASPDARIRPIRTRPAVKYRVRGGLLQMVVYEPTETGPFPAIVMIYGGAWQRGVPEDNADFARYMASRGYVVCAIDYRHAPEFQFPVHLEDVQDALLFIQRHASEFQIDTARMAFLGRSSGGHLALLAGYEQSLWPVRAWGWYGTELMCNRGHGLLHVPEIPTSWSGTQKWLYLDRSWSGLFPYRP